MRALRPLITLALVLFALALLNVVFNLLPVLHQRYKRARLRAPFQLQTAPVADAL